MTEFEKLVYDYLLENGPSKTKEMREKLAPDVSPNIFRQRLGRMSHQRQIENIRDASRNQPGAWQAINTVIYASAAGEVAPPNRRDVMRAPIHMCSQLKGSM